MIVRHRAAYVAAVVLVMLLGVAGTAPTAVAAPSGKETVTTPSGLRVTVSPVRDLSARGAKVRVRGSGFDPTVGIYIALCVTPRAGARPSPCGGGVNMTAADPASAWISSNPPPYGRALAQPYSRGGRFVVDLTISPQIGEVDCRVASCSIVTRADHLRIGDRRFDVAVPVRFAPPSP
jgi:hypothetical protein